MSYEKDPIGVEKIENCHYQPLYLSFLISNFIGLVVISPQYAMIPIN